MVSCGLKFALSIRNFCYDLTSDLASQICNLWVDVMEKVARADFFKGTMYGNFSAPQSIKKRPAFECSGR